MQHEITSPLALLESDGSLTEPGWARSLLWDYRRAAVKASPLRIKEWDYYCVSNGRIALALTVADNGYMGLGSASLLSLAGDQPWEITKSPMTVLPLGRTGLPESSARGVTSLTGRGFRLLFRAEKDQRLLAFHMENFRGGETLRGEIRLTEAPKDSIVIATPFEKPRHFYYNQKINCLRAEGSVSLGDETWRFDPTDAFAVLDWGRGVWTYHNTWYWSSASGALDGVPFGFNLGYGFGDTSAATENALFHGGRLHKLEDVDFGIPQRDGKPDFLSPWHFTSSDGRFTAEFRPILDRAACTDFQLLKSDQHQVFGPSGGGKTPWLRRFAGEAGRCLTDEEVRGLLLAQAQTGDPALLQRTLSPFPRLGLDDLDLLLSGRPATEQALQADLLALADAGTDIALAGIDLDARLPALRAALAEALGPRFRPVSPSDPIPDGQPS